jgi:hypothetical protein
MTYNIKTWRHGEGGTTEAIRYGEGVSWSVVRLSTQVEQPTTNNDFTPLLKISCNTKQAVSP